MDRLERFDPKLRCVITLTREHALTQARQADTEIAAGHYHGPLHGIPWGAKDLLDTANIPTTYGAEPYKNRVPKASSTNCPLDAAGAVLVAKLSLGALALNDLVRRPDHESLAAWKKARPAPAPARARPVPPARLRHGRRRRRRRSPPCAAASPASGRPAAAFHARGRDAVLVTRQLDRSRAA